jgi:hypothetical protein
VRPFASTMNPTTGTSGPAPTATFHARVAGVGLVTTLVVLVAACLTFMLQQWAVARTQSHQMYTGLAQITATTEAQAMASGDAASVRAAVQALAGSRNVEGAQLTDAKGALLASFRRPPAPKPQAGQAIPVSQAAPTGPLETIRTDVVSDGRKIGVLALTVHSPALTASGRGPVPRPRHGASGDRAGRAPVAGHAPSGWRR